MLTVRWVTTETNQEGLVWPKQEGGRESLTWPGGTKRGKWETPEVRQHWEKLVLTRHKVGSEEPPSLAVRRKKKG